MCGYASASQFIGHEPFCDISKTLAMKAISTLVQKEHERRKRNILGLGMSKF